MAMDYQAFASLFTPNERDYIAAYVAAKIQEALEPAATQLAQATDSYQRLMAEVQTLKDQVAAYESKFRDDTKYALTRAKVIALLKKEGIY